MKVVYDGPQPSRTLDLGPGKEITVERGKPFDVLAEVGEQLCEQRHYSAVGGEKSDGKKKPGKRATLNDRADELGVESPEKLKNIAAVEAAIAEAEAAAVNVPEIGQDQAAAGDGDDQERE